MADPHRHKVRIYWEDTDAGGIVYYANYMKFAERARTEALRSGGIDQIDLLETDGVAILVRRFEIDFLSPARLDDIITIETHLQDIGKARMTMEQVIKKDTKGLVRLHVQLVCVDRQMKPIRIPEKLTKALETNQN